MQRYGMILILSSPSGVGKSTIGRILRADKSVNLGLSVSVTTRKKRPSEQDGVDYHFVSEGKFQQLAAEQAFIEWAEVHGAHYGTLQKSVDKVLQNGQDMLFDIDYQGAEQLRKKRPHDVVSVFILPPSMAELRKRLRERAENSGADMRLRLSNAAREMRRWRKYDYAIVNDDLGNAVAALKAIITAERLRRRRLPGLKTFIDSLLAEA